MNVLDENIPRDQADLLRQWNVRFRSISRDLGYQGIADEDIVPLLLRLKKPTLLVAARAVSSSGSSVNRTNSLAARATRSRSLKLAMPKTVRDRIRGFGCESKGISASNAASVLMCSMARAASAMYLSSWSSSRSFGKADAALVPRISNPFTACSRISSPRCTSSFVGDLLPPDRAIPPLTKKFSDPRSRVVQSALGGFFAAGPHAEPAMPLIATMLTNHDEKTRRIATNVLLTINPYRAPEFGVITNGLEERYYRIHRKIRQEFATNNIPSLRQ